MKRKKTYHQGRAQTMQGTSFEPVNVITSDKKGAILDR